MDLKEAASSLGLKYNNETTHENIHRELRYNFIIHIVRGKNSYMGANKVPEKNINVAKELAWENLKKENNIKKLKKDDIISFKCFEIVFCDVPVETVIKGSIFQMQPIESRWLMPEEIKELLMTK